MPAVSTMTEKGKIRDHLSRSSKGLWGGCRSLLVPLMIAVFTITTTILQMEATRLINEQNLKVAIDNRDISNYTRLQQFNIEEARLEHERSIDDKRRAVDFMVAENRQMDSTLAIYMKEMSEILLNDQFTLENRRWAVVVRAKTLTLLRQLDGKRKSHAIQFLYEAQLLTNKTAAINLNNADLNNVDMSGQKLDNISLSGASLVNASFVGTSLNNSYFDFTKLSNSTFEKAKLFDAVFNRCDASEAIFDDADLTGATFHMSRLLKSSWRNVDGLRMKFDKARVDDADFSNADLGQTSFYWTSLRGVAFTKASLKNVDWRSADVLGTNFYQADLRESNINSKQLRQMFSYEGAKIFNGTQAKGTNLLNTGSAEALQNGTCSVNSWRSEGTVVARRYWPNKVASSLGACFFTGIEGLYRATMRQRVKVDCQINANDTCLWMYGRCRELIPEDEFKIDVQIVQFDRENSTLTNQTHTLNLYSDTVHNEKCFPCLTRTTEVEFGVTFKRQISAPTNRTFGYCDNLRLSIHSSS